MANEEAGVGVDTALAATKSVLRDIVATVRHLHVRSGLEKTQTLESASGCDSACYLFSWPAEIRLLLYESIADTMTELNTTDWGCSEKHETVVGYPRNGSRMTRHIWDLPQGPFQQPSRTSFETLQFVSSQFRHEFLAAWAESFVHHIHLPVEFFRWPYGRLLGQRVPETIKQVAHQLSAGLKEWLVDVDWRFHVAHRVKHVVLCTKLISRTRVSPGKEIYRFLGQHIARYFDALTAGLVHPKIRVEVAIVCVHVFDGSSGWGQRFNGRSRRARRRFVLQLAPSIGEQRETEGPAWVCTSESAIEERMFSTASGEKTAAYEWSILDSERSA